MEITIQKHHEKTFEKIKNQAHSFEDDLLERKELANHLVQIIKNIKSPFVFNINSPYGTGKTFFLTRLKVLLEQEKCTSVLYNSWETDWANDPFVAILEEITEEINHLLKSKNSLITKTAKEAWKFIHPAFISLGKELAKQCIPGASIIVTVTEKALERKNKRNTPAAATQYQAIKQAKENLRRALVKFTSQLEKPLVIIIDELDRCRPDYAVRTLEAIKHFFNIPNMVFVLAIDREQIESAISVLYGEKIENHSAEYLRKFIDYDFYLPQPTPEKFINMLMTIHIADLVLPFCQVSPTSFSVPLHTNLKLREGSPIYQQIMRYMLYLLIIFSQYFQFSLRTQEQLILRLRVFISSLDIKTNIFIPELAIWLVALYLFDQKSFLTFKKHKMSESFLLKSVVSSDEKFRRFIAEQRLDIGAILRILESKQNDFLTEPLTAYLDKLLRQDRDGAFEESLQREATNYLEIASLI